MREEVNVHHLNIKTPAILPWLIKCRGHTISAYNHYREITLTGLQSMTFKNTGRGEIDS